MGKDRKLNCWKIKEILKKQNMITCLKKRKLDFYEIKKQIMITCLKDRKLDCWKIKEILKKQNMITCLKKRKLDFYKIKKQKYDNLPEGQKTRLLEDKRNFEKTKYD